MPDEHFLATVCMLFWQFTDRTKRAAQQRHSSVQLESAAGSLSKSDAHIHAEYTASDHIVYVQTIIPH